jgi:urease accessory protein UreF
MSLSNYPNGFEHGLTIRNQPILSTHSGNIFWVGKTPEGQAGSNGYSGTFNWPFASIDFAIGKCIANHGDIIIVKAGHTETISAAGAITADIAGISIIGLGSGADRPALTFGTLTTASFVLSAASVTIENIIGKSALDALINPFNVTGDDCYLDIEWQDASATVEAERAVLATGANRLTTYVKYRGFITGDACVNAVRLVGCADPKVVVDAYGEFSVGIVEMVTTASTNVLASGYFYNDNVALTKNVVNTGGLACTWFTYGYDGKGGYGFSGGSAAALASDDVSTLISVLGALNDAAATGAVTDTDTAMAYIKQLVTEGITRDAVIGALNNAAASGAVTDADTLMAYAKQLVTEGIARDAVIGALNNAAASGAVTDADTMMAYIKQLVTEGIARDAVLTVLGAVDTAAASGAVTDADLLMAYVKQLVTEGIARDAVLAVLGAVDTAAAAGAVTDVDLLMAYIKQLVTAAVADAVLSGSRKKVIADDLAAADITGTVTRFTITGGPIRVLSLGVWVSTAIPAGANTMQFGYTPAGGGGANTLSGAIDTASAAADQLFLLDGTKATAPIKTTDVGVLAAGQLLTSTPIQGVILAPGVITTIFSAGPPLTGAMTVFMEYEPMTPTAAVA